MNPAVTLVLAASILVQLLALGLALRLIGVTGRKTSWILIATALAFMAVRCSITLYHVTLGARPGAADLTTELLALTISLLMAWGIWRIPPVFRSIEAAARTSRSAQERFRGLVEHTSDWIWELDDHRIFTYSSPRVQDFLGYDPGEVLGKHPEDLMPASAAERSTREQARMMTRSSPFDRIVNVLLHKNGHEVILETSGVPVLDGNGRLRAYRGISRDVTLRVRAERRLERLYRALRVLSRGRSILLHATSEEALLLQACQVAVEEGGHRFAWAGYALSDPNHGIRVMARWGEDEGYLDAIQVRWDESPLGSGPTGEALRSGQAVMIGNIGSDPQFGPWRDLALKSGFRSSVALPLRHGEQHLGTLNVYAAEAEAFDPEEVKLLQDFGTDLACGVLALRVQSEKEELTTFVQHRQRLEALGEVTGGIAHDLNNLITIVLTSTDLMKNLLPRDMADELRTYLEETQSAAMSGAELVKRMLSFSRREPLQLKPLDLVDEVRRITDILPRLLPENILVHFSTRPAGLDSLPIEGDAGAIEQILLNLATNARDAMTEGGMLRICVTEQHLDERDALTHGPLRPGDYACLSVEDEGVGMPDEVKARALDPFFTTKGPGKGTGLGLSVTFGLVTQHDGILHIYSEPGHGAAVRVYFPRTQALSDRPVKTDDKPIVGGRETVLVVDDEAGLRRAARRSLERFGYNVIVAENGESALKMIEAHMDEIDLVVSDLRMPGIDGLELYNATLAAGMNIPFIITSGYTYLPESDATRARARSSYRCRFWRSHGT